MKFGRAWAIVALVLGIFAAPFAADAQQPGKVFRIGILGTVPPTTPEVSRIWEALLQGLRDLGYVEGQNIVIERRYSEGRNERLPDLAADLVRLKVDVIVAAGTPPPYAAKRATTTIPIVMTNASDPVGSGLVASLARPGGNITGLSLLSPELAGKQLELRKPMPALNARSTSSGVATPSSTRRTASFMRSACIRGPMNPGESAQRTGTLPSASRSAMLRATTAGAVAAPGTTSTSGMMWAGLSQWATRNRSGRCTASARCFGEIVELVEATIASGATRAERRPRTSRLRSSSSGSASWT